MQGFGEGFGNHENGWRLEVMEALAWIARLTRQRYTWRGPRHWEDGHNILRRMARRVDLEDVDTRNAEEMAVVVHKLRVEGEAASRMEMVRAIARTRPGEGGALRRRLEAEDMRRRLIARGALPRETPAITLSLIRRVVRWTGGDCIRLELADEPLIILERLAKEEA